MAQQADPYKVQEIRALKDKPEAAKAQELLERVASQVQPIMRKHQFRVPLLVEFYPRQASLLGLNMGGGGGGTHDIRLRLRRADSPASMLPYEAVLSTMLHELSHNIRSPHDAVFYKLLDDLKAECEDLMARGIFGTGAGFDAPAAGKAGGRPVGRDLSKHAQRDLALRAAQQRAHRQAIMPGGAIKLGGDPTLRQGCTPREAAAFAAERRARDNVWCPNEQLEWETAARGGAVDAALQAVLGAGGPEQQQADASARQQADASTRQPLSARAGPGSSGGPGRGSSAAAAAMVAALGAAPRRRWPGADGPAQQELAARASHPAATQLQQPQAPGRCPEVVDLTGASGSDEEDRAPGGGWQPDPKRARAGSSGGGGGGGGSAASSEGWPCPQCTLVNRSVALQCEACLSVRPARFTVP